jgi:hypothetical protein
MGVMDHFSRPELMSWQIFVQETLKSESQTIMNMDEKSKDLFQSNECS